MDIMCGEYPASRCSANKWFTYMGSADNVYVPFQITYIQHDNSSSIIDGYRPLDPPTVPCSSPLNVSYLYYAEIILKLFKSCHLL